MQREVELAEEKRKIVSGINGNSKDLSIALFPGS